VVKGHPRTLATKPFDRAYMTYKLCVYLVLFLSYSQLLAICRPSGCTVVSGVVVVIVGICNHSQMRNSKCTGLIFGVSIGLDPG